MTKKRLAIGLLMASLLSSASATIDRPELTAFINDMVSKHDFNSAELTRLFSQVTLRPDIIDAITRPAEAKPWYDYRPIFVNEARIAGGVEFWNQHADILARAQAMYGVPPEIITAIIGVETRYGKNTGSYRVLDALATLALDYPKRSDFFRDELEQYLLLAREEKLDPLAVKGSYAGAMGMPQFIASSYRNFAVDFDHDGRRDLLNSLSDVIGSVANYFSAHEWQPDQPVAVSVQVIGDQYQPLINADLKPVSTLAQLKKQGVNVPADLAPDQLGTLLEYEGDSGMEYWLGLQNFYVITRYNRSPLYAMAVYQLSNEIRARHDAQINSEQ